jgi:rare lipoprotein A
MLLRVQKLSSSPDARKFQALQETGRLYDGTSKRNHFIFRLMSESPKPAPIRHPATLALSRSSADRQLTVGFSSRPAFLFPLIVLSFLLAAIRPAFAQNRFYHPTQQPYIINDQVYYPVRSSSGFNETGVASWYGPDFNGHSTSNGETYDMYGATAAHKLLPMNTMLLVSNLENGKNTIVRVNDRGPFVQGRILDLSYTAAKKLDIVGNGTAKVQVTALAKANADSGEEAIPGPDVNYNLGEFYVQIGAFEQKNNALKLQKRFSDIGHTAVIEEFFSPKSILYRVCVYAGKELHGAYKVEGALHQHGWRGAFVVAR